MPHTITYQVRGEIRWIDVSTVQEANKKIAEIESKFNIPGNAFRWTHPIEEQTRGLADQGQLLCE